MTDNPLLGKDLTDTELRVLTGRALGFTIDQIAKILFRSPHTVKCQVHTINQKLGAKNGLHAIYLAMRKGLIK